MENYGKKRYTCQFCKKEVNRAYKCKKCGHVNCKDCGTMGNSFIGKIFRRGLVMVTFGISDWVMSQCPSCGSRSVKTV